MNNTQKLQHLKKITKKWTSMEDLINIITDQEKEIINQKRKGLSLVKLVNIIILLLITIVGIIGWEVYNSDFLVGTGIGFFILTIIEYILIIKNYYKND